MTAQMITWEPSAYIPGRGVVKLDLEQLRDFSAVARGEATPKSDIAKAFFNTRPSTPA